VDFAVIRENTEGVYTDAGGVFKQGTPDEIAIQEDINTRKGSSALFDTPLSIASSTRSSTARRAGVCLW